MLAVLAEQDQQQEEESHFVFHASVKTRSTPLTLSGALLARKTIKKRKSQLSFQTLLDIKWFINLFIDYLKKMIQKTFIFHLSFHS